MARGSGVQQTKAAVYISNGYIPFRTVIAKFLTCALAIGGGHSLGPEDPSLQIGAGLASLFGRRLQLSRDKLRLIAPVGAAAGLAAAFNSPITAVLFVIEEVIGTWSAGALGAIVLSAVAAVVTEQWFLGGEPLFRVPAFSSRTRWSSLSYAALGVAGGCAALVFVKLATTLRPRLRALPRWTQILQPAIAGAIIGADRDLVSAGDGRRLRARGRGDARPVCVGHARGARRPEDAGDRALVRERHARGPLRAHAVHRRDARRRGVRHRPHRRTGRDGPDRRLRARRHGDALRRHPARADDVGVHDGGGLGQLLDRAAGDDLEQHRLHDLAALPAHADLRGAVAPGRGRAAVHGGAARDAPAARRRRHARDDARARRRHDGRRRACASSKARPDGAVPVLLAGAIWAGVSERELEALDAGGHGCESLQQALGPDARVAAVHRDQPLDTALRLLRNRPLLPVVHRADRTRIEGVITLDDILAVYRDG